MIPQIASLAAAAAPLATGSGPEIPWSRIILAFFFCIGLAVAAITFIRARGGGNDMRSLLKGLGAKMTGEPDELTLVSRLRIGPGHQVCVIRCKHREYLLHIGPQSALLIDELSEQEKGTP